MVTILNKRSDQLTEYAMGGERADLLVSELIDDHVIGDGVLSSISDARRRLLTPSAYIVPRGGRMFALPVSYRAVAPPGSGIALDDLNLIRSEQLVLSHPYYHTKLQRLEESEYEVLGPPVQLFEWDWAHEEPPGHHGMGGTLPPTPMPMSKSGVLNGLLLYFTLQMDAHEGMEAQDPSYADTPATAE